MAIGIGSEQDTLMISMITRSADGAPASATIPSLHGSTGSYPARITALTNRVLFTDLLPRMRRGVLASVVFEGLWNDAQGLIQTVFSGVFVHGEVQCFD